MRCPPGQLHECSGVSEDEMRGWIVLPSLRLLACAVEKNGLTLQTALAHAALNTSRWGYSQYFWKHFTTFRRDAANASAAELLQLRDPAWRSSFVWRDPVDRFTSAYNSKCRQKDPSSRQHCHDFLQLQSRGAPPLSAVLASLRNRSGAPCSWNPHWAPQSCFCGLSNHTRAARITHLIPFRDLSRGLEAFYRGRVEPAKIPSLRQQMSRLTMAPAMARWPSHCTHSTSASLAPSVQAEVRQLYRVDYALLRALEVE